MRRPLPARPVSSYLAFSPLPANRNTPAVYFLRHSLSLHLSGRSARALPGIVPRGARTFLWFPSGDPVRPIKEYTGVAKKRTPSPA